MSRDAPLNINPAFAAPLVETRHPDPEPLNRALEQLFLQREGPDIEPSPRTPTLKEGAKNPDNGVLRFLDARPAASMYLDPGNMHMRRPYGHGSINYRLEAGQLIIFPSHLMHEVAPYHGRSERITVASNFWFRSG